MVVHYRASLAKTGEFQLVGITDTAMLRPQVFALQEGEVSIGLVCSEKQAIDATLASLASEDARFTPVADHYWNARGGSSTDGGAFLMTVSPRVGVPALAGNGATSEKQKPPKGGTPTGHEVGVPALAGNGATSEKQKPPKGGTPTGHEVGVPALAGNGDRVTGGSSPVASRQPPKGGTPTSYSLRVTNKFGEQISTLPGQVHCNLSIAAVKPLQTARTDEDLAAIERAVQNDDPPGLFAHLRERMEEMDYDRLRSFVDQIVSQTEKRTPVLAIETLTLAIDRRSPTGSKKRSSVLTILRDGLERVFERQPLCGEAGGSTHLRVTWQTRGRIRSPEQGETTLLIDARRFPAEGEHCDARLAIEAYRLGWRHIVHYNSRGTRFHGVGFGPGTDGLRIDCYDNPGDYLGSGMDGLEVYVHGNAQDQLCQIAKRGRLVVFGDVGQTFLYGAKGGEHYVLGNAAGRPMINAVGRPRVVINGTALDFLAESFMAGNPHTGGGFAIVNGVRFDQQGRLVPLELPYPGSNLLSLASGGAIYLRDPNRTLVDEQLNGGAFRPLSGADWKLIVPYLEENERLFGIRVHEDLLSVNGVLRSPREVYRKVMPRKDAEIEAEMEALAE